MKFTELTEQDKQHLKEIYYKEITHEEKVDLLSKEFECTSRTIRRWWMDLGLSRMNRDNPQLEEARKREISDDTDIVIVTTAQDSTTVNTNFLNNILAYKEFLANTYNKKVELIVIPLHYRNPTSIREVLKNDPHVQWGEQVNEYLYYNKIIFGDSLIYANNHITPTMENPLNGREGFAANNHLILGHPRLHFKTVPRLVGMPLRVMATTGAVTYRNYSESNSGEKADFHHSYGFIIIEKKADDTCYIPRNIKAKSDGSFVDIVFKVEDSKVSIIERSLGLVVGDLHVRQIDDTKMKKTKEMLSVLRPEVIVFNDVFDGDTLNPYQVDDLYIRKQHIKNKQYIIGEEVEEAIQYVLEFTKDFNGEVKIVQSNHDDFLDRHINKFQWKTDLHNSEHYLRYALIQQTEDLISNGNIFGFLVNKHDKLRYITDREMLYIGGYNIQHTHLGVNGAAGNPQSFKRLNLKVIGGHTHSPMILDNVNIAGCSCVLRPHYVKGLSSWAHCDIVIHENNKNQLIVYDDKYEVSGLI